MGLETKGRHWARGNAPFPSQQGLQKSRSGSLYKGSTQVGGETQAYAQQAIVALQPEEIASSSTAASSSDLVTARGQFNSRNMVRFIYVQHMDSLHLFPTRLRANSYCHIVTMRHQNNGQGVKEEG